ncbi:MAG: ABC transporter ATP-binding protein [Candidatus Woesearchaeota archaeon]
MVIEVDGLSKYFGEFQALGDLSLKVEKGNLFGLLGPNGSGKSTLIKIMTGQIKPSKGSIRVLHKDPVNDPLIVRKICGIIPEQETPPSFLTAQEYLYFVSDVRQSDTKEIDWWMDFLDFRHEKDKLCKDLSRGTRQKLMFAQAFMHKPKVAFIDEPLINLDPIIQAKIKGFLKKKVKEDTTIFLSTHVLEIAQEICTKIAIISKGSIIYSGNVKKNLDQFFLKKVD